MNQQTLIDQPQQDELHEYQDREYEDSNHIPEILEEDNDEDDEISAAPAWIISLVVHGLIALVLGTIYFGTLLEEEEPPIRISTPQAPIEEDEEEKEERTLEEVEITIESDVISDQAIVTDLDIPIEEIETEDPVEQETAEPKGREEAVSTAEAGGAMAFMAIGAGGGASDAFGSRSGGGKKRALKGNGGSRASESAVNAALIWFQKHQSDNGMWDVDGYMDNCQDGNKCEPGNIHQQANGGGDSACSAYALLCFLGAGYDHRTPGKFKKTVAKGMKWLLSVQNADGTFGVQMRNYENPICTMSICEAYAMTNDRELKEPAQRAVNALLARQAVTDNFPYGAAWDYTAANPKRNDASVSGWCVMALKAAKSAGLDTGEGWEGSKQWFDAHWQASNPGVNANSLGTGDKSYFAYVYNQVDDTVFFNFGNKVIVNMDNRRAVECVGALCAVFLGKRPGDGILDSLIQTVMDEQMPVAYPTNTYWMYYNTLSVFQYGGDDWKKWNGTVRDLLVNAQHGKGTGCFNGSWDSKGTGGKIGHHIEGVGRLLSTAYCCLSLEVYYRYERLKKKK